MNHFVIVGAGPAGLSMALQLSQQGQRVTLLEASRTFSRQFRGDALMPCGLEALEMMGLRELLETLPQRQLSGWSVWMEGRELFEVAEPMGSCQPCRLVAQGPLLEALLVEAVKQPTLQWRSGCTVTGLVKNNKRITGVRLSNGETIEAEFVVGCDGRSSTVRRLAGLPVKPRGSTLDLLWFELPGREGEPLPQGFHTLLAGGAIGSVCLGAKGDLLMALLVKPGTPTPQHSAAEWAKTLATMQPAAFAEHICKHSAELKGPLRVSVQAGIAPQWHKPGVLLLGDAAHPMSPVRAQGINMALRDSVVAAGVLTQQRSAAELDAVAANVQHRRQAELEAVQKLQEHEMRLGQLLGHQAMLRHLVINAAGLCAPIAKSIWTKRQRLMRDGLPKALLEKNQG
jgi:2-polyprenyl-6-methoxyphenol hydroxylase-like FAD-dependent oxidoreductase